MSARFAVLGGIRQHARLAVTAAPERSSLVFLNTTRGTSGYGIARQQHRHTSYYTATAATAWQRQSRIRWPTAQQQHLRLYSSGHRRHPEQAEHEAVTVRGNRAARARSEAQEQHQQSGGQSNGYRSSISNSSSHFAEMDGGSGPNGGQTFEGDTLRGACRALLRSSLKV